LGFCHFLKNIPMRAKHPSGVEFIDESGGGSRVRVRKPNKTKTVMKSRRLARSIKPRVSPRDTGAGARKLRQLDAAATIEDLRNPPGNRLELLKGDRAGQMSIRINDQWRICFRWVEKDAEDVEMDYH
jgi:proteic killer suppression protein